VRRKDPQQDQSIYDMDTAELVEEAQRKFPHLKAGVADPEEVQGGGGHLDPMLPMLEALRKEVEALGKLHHDAKKNLSAGLPLLYGKNTLVEGPAARYEFWPSMAKEWPLLYFCAQAILAAASNATTFNERMHSPAGTIYSNLRSSLRPSSVEHLTLALLYGRKWAKEKMAMAKGDWEREELGLDAEALREEEAKEEEEEVIIDCL
jgi:hypothetical protein